jgi:hypothetical protein
VAALQYPGLDQQPTDEGLTSTMSSSVAGQVLHAERLSMEIGRVLTDSRTVTEWTVWLGYE